MSNAGFHTGRPTMIEFPDPQHETRLAIAMPDFNQLKEEVSEMLFPVISWANWVTLFIGSAIAFLTAWLSVDAAAHEDAAMIFMLAFIGSVILAAFMGWVGWHVRKIEKTRRNAASRTLDRLEKTCPRLTPAGELEQPAPDTEESQPEQAA